MDSVSTQHETELPEKEFVVPVEKAVERAVLVPVERLMERRSIALSEPEAQNEFFLRRITGLRRTLDGPFAAVTWMKVLLCFLLI